MPNPQNIKPARPGECRNPAGRPKGSRNRSTIVREWLEASEKIVNPITGKQEHLTQADIITLALIKRARRGDVPAWNALMDSGFGKIADVQTLQNPDGTGIHQPQTKTREQIIQEAAEWGIKPEELGFD